MYRKPLRFYVSGPYSAATVEEREANTKEAIRVGIQLMAKGHYPMIPHLYHYLDLQAKDQHLEFDWEEFMKLDIAWLSQAEAFFYIGSSKGADIELIIAASLGLPIYHKLIEVASVLPISEAS